MLGREAGDGDRESPRGESGGGSTVVAGVLVKP